MINTTYSVAGLLDAVRREMDHAAGMPGTFEDGARWALGNIEGRSSRADQLHALVNEGKQAVVSQFENSARRTTP